MAKRIKKPVVRPEKRREWLERYESGGESPPSIAEKDKFDVRTVRKQIEKAKEEREAREARAAVVRGALEEHYRDIVEFVEGLDAEVNAEATISLSLRENPMWKALKEHQLRSPLWGYLRDWDNLHDKINTSIDDIRTRLEREVGADNRLTGLTSDQHKSAVSGILAALSFQAQQWARGIEGLDLDQHFISKPQENGDFEIEYGSFHFGAHNEKHVKAIRDIIGDLEEHFPLWKEYEDFQKAVEHLLKVKDKIRDELMIVRYRRIVPGHCRYCPL